MAIATERIVGHIVEADCERCDGSGLTKAYCVLCKQSIAHDDSWYAFPDDQNKMPCGHEVFYLKGLDYCGACNGTGKVRKRLNAQLIES